MTYFDYINKLVMSFIKCNDELGLHVCGLVGQNSFLRKPRGRVNIHLPIYSFPKDFTQNMVIRPKMGAHEKA
jgi:hypothetical protein